MRRTAALVLLATLGATQEAKPLTFTKDVAPVVFAHCSGCHRGGEVAPFVLMEYEDVRKRAKQIVETVEARRMPPWKPVEGHGDFVGERRLKPAEIGTLKKWVEEGAVEGDPKDLPAPPKFADRWAHGEPDLVVQMPEAAKVPAEGRDIYRAFAIPLNLTEDKYIRAVQYRASNPKVVHHSLIFLDRTGEARKRDEADPEPGFKGQGLSFGDTIGGWTPGGVNHPFPENTGKILKKGADLLLQLHLHPIGKVEKEQSQIAFWFLKKPPRRTVMSFPIIAVNFDLPAGDKAVQVTDSVVLPCDVTVIGIIPHSHYLGKECKVWAVTPDGKEVPLVWVKDWDFDWQEQYRYKVPVQLPKLTELKMIWTFDNSASNPRQHTLPPRRVVFGEQTTDEMAVAVLHLASGNPVDKVLLYSALIARPTPKMNVGK
jgi:hypothetical protein